jgi:hypothetical protein
MRDSLVVQARKSDSLYFRGSFVKNYSRNGEQWATNMLSAMSYIFVNESLRTGLMVVTKIEERMFSGFRCYMAVVFCRLLILVSSKISRYLMKPLYLMSWS